MNPDQQELIDKMRRVMDHDQPSPELSEEELRRIREMLAAFEAFIATGRLGKWFVGVVVGLSATIAAVVYLLDQVRTWTAGQ